MLIAELGRPEPLSAILGVVGGVFEPNCVCTQMLATVGLDCASVGEYEQVFAPEHISDLSARS